MSPLDGRPDPQDPLRRSVLVTLLLAGVLLLAKGNRADPDLWGHVLYGQDVLAHGELPRTATYTFTAPDQPWINHENLSELLFAALVNHGGAPALLVLKCLLGLVVVGLMIAAAQRARASVLVTCLLVLLATYNLSIGWSVRPQLFTYVFFAVMMAAVDRGGWGLWVVPPLFAVWANSHGGFVAGLAILAAYLGCRSFEALWREGWQAVGSVTRYALVLVASVLATLVNPYGLELLRWLLHDLPPPRPEITEWHALSPAQGFFWRFVALLGLTIAAWLGGRRRPDLARTVVLGLVGWQSVAHVRHIPFFAILAGLWLPGRMEALVARVRRGPRAAAGEPGPAVRAIRSGVWVMTAVLAGIVVGVCWQGVWVERSIYPVKAFRYMARERLVGKLVVHFDWAQYALAAFAPETTVAFDGRFRTCYPQEIADMHFDFIQGADPPGRWRSDRSPPIDGARVLEFGKPDLVLLSRASRNSVKVMQAQSDWILLYQDGLAQLWGRRERYDSAADPHYVPPARRRITDRPQAGAVPWPALPQRAGLASDHARPVSGGR